MKREQKDAAGSSGPGSGGPAPAAGGEPEQGALAAWLWRYRAVVIVAAFVAGLAIVPVWRTPPEVEAIAGQGVASTLPTVSTTWRTLGRLDALTGYVPPEVGVLGGRRVRIAGFLVPLEDDAQLVSEFLLVPYFGACIHLPPPPPNQMIYVKMVGAPVRVNLAIPMIIEGELTVATVDSPYGKVGYVIAGREVRPYDPQVLGSTEEG